MKKLQFWPEKCHQLHIGKKKVKCPDLFIDEWKLEKKNEIETGVDNLVDVLADEYKIEVAEEEKYLGNMISVDGKNTKNVEAKVDKAKGIINQLKNMLEEMCFGKYLFEVAITLRNGILTYLEVSYGLNDTEIEKLEQYDEQKYIEMSTNINHKS
jgi:hypothetical protein